MVFVLVCFCSCCVRFVVVVVFVFVFCFRLSSVFRFFVVLFCCVLFVACVCVCMLRRVVVWFVPSFVFRFVFVVH